MERDIIIFAIGGAANNITKTVLNEINQTLKSKIRIIYAHEDIQYLNSFSQTYHYCSDFSIIQLDFNNPEIPNDIFYGAKKIIVIAGLGGRVGSKFSVLAIKSAITENKNSTYFIGTLPFYFEGSIKRDYALTVLDIIKNLCGNNVTIYDNEEISSFINNLTGLDFLETFKYIDSAIAKRIETILTDTEQTENN